MLIFTTMDSRQAAAARFDVWIDNRWLEFTIKNAGSFKNKWMGFLLLSVTCKNS